MLTASNFPGLNDLLYLVNFEWLSDMLSRQGRDICFRSCLFLALTYRENQRFILTLLQNVTNFHFSKEVMMYDGANVYVNYLYKHNYNVMYTRRHLGRIIVL